MVMKKTNAMKKTLNSFLIILAIVFGIIGCKDEVPELPDLIPVADLQFEITQNPNDPNMVILESMTPNVIPLWTTPMGRSTRVKDTVKLAFEGSYKFVYSVAGGGGIVNSDTVTLDISTTNLSYVDDPLWNNLTGGVGESKDWVLDIDAEGNSKYWGGPMYFSGDVWRWGGSCSEEGDKCWIWEAGWVGNEWIAAANDYGVMNFSLEGNAVVTVNHMNSPGRGDEVGTYFLDVDNKTLSMSDAAPLMNDWVDGANIDDWRLGYVISLTEDAMQLAYKDKGKEEFIIFNYITKEYSDNWVPEDQPDPNPPIDLGGGTAQGLISVTTSKTWTLSPETPFNWTDLEGNFLNDWQSIGDYPDWAGYRAEHQADVAASEIVFHADGKVETKSGGVEAEGTYAVEEGTNLISFTDVMPSFQMGDWAVASTTDANQWKIVKTATTGSTVTDIWFGKRDPDKPEYMVFHFVLGSSGFDPIEANKQLIINSLTGGSSRTFKVSDSWHVDWLAADLTGGWTGPTTFADDFTSNSWVWTQAVKDGLQDPTLTFTLNAGVVTVTKAQDGVTTNGTVTIDAENNTLSIDIDLIAFKDAAAWLPVSGDPWYICKVPLANIETDGMWLGDMNDDGTEVTAIHYVISN